MRQDNNSIDSRQIWRNKSKHAFNRTPWPTLPRWDDFSFFYMLAAKPYMALTFLVLSLCILSKTDTTIAVPLEKTVIYKNNFWAVGMSGERFTYKAGDGFELLGNGGLVSMGYGIIKDRWYVIGNADIITGPFDPNQNRNHTLDIDFQGTGVNAWWGYSAQELDLRHPTGGYGFTVGLNYQDIVGKSLSKDIHAPMPTHLSQAERLGHDFKIRMTTLAISPGIFICWMKPPRTYGSKLEHLQTRIEGYLLSLAFSYPIFANYHSRHNDWVLSEPGKYEPYDPSGDNNREIPLNEWEKTAIISRGNLKGGTIIISMQIMLGY